MRLSKLKSLFKLFDEFFAQYDFIPDCHINKVTIQFDQIILKITTFKTSSYSYCKIAFIVTAQSR